MKINLSEEEVRVIVAMCGLLAGMGIVRENKRSLLAGLVLKIGKVFNLDDCSIKYKTYFYTKKDEIEAHSMRNHRVVN